MPSVASLSLPGRLDHANEDALALADGVGVVVDGAGIPAEFRSGCSHSVAWYADHLATAFRDRLAQRSDGMADALAHAIATVRDRHADRCDLQAGSPSATVAAWRVTDDVIEHLVLCDASIVVVPRDGVAMEVTDRRLDETVARVADRFGRADVSAAALRSRRLAIEANRNRPGGFWCAQADPAVAAHSLTGSTPRAELAAIIAASDGATRGHQGLRLFPVERFAALAMGGADGLRELSNAIRAGETARETRKPGAHGKPHDDLSVAALVL